MILAFSFLKRITLYDGPKCEIEGRCLIPSSISFSENRAVSISPNTDKENVPSSGGRSSGSVNSQGGWSGHTEQTPRPRKSKYSPKLVQLPVSQDAHTVSHIAFSPLFVFVCCFSHNVVFFVLFFSVGLVSLFAGQSCCR